MHGFVWNSGSLDNNEFQNVLPKDAKAENFAMEQKIQVFEQFNR